MKFKYLYIIALGIVLWILETALFGWNTTAQSAPEMILDVLSWLLIIWGVIGDIADGIHYVKNTIVQAGICANCEKPLPSKTDE